MDTSKRKTVLDNLLKPHLLDIKDKRKISNSFHKMGDYFQEIPLDKIFNILKDNGIVPIMEDNTKWEGFLIGAEGSAIIPLAYKYTEKMVNNLSTYQPIENCALSLSWYKMNSCIECVFYIN